MKKPSNHYGIIVLKMLPDIQAINQVHQVLQVLLNSEKDFKGKLYIVDRNKYRKRKV